MQKYCIRLEARSTYTDKTLFSRISEGDEQAFSTLFYQYLPLLKGVIFKLCKNEAAVFDLVQEVFLKIWLHRDELEQVQAPRNWILHIAYNSTFNWLKSQKIKMNAELNSSNAEPTTREYFNDPASLAQLRSCIATAVEQLPVQARKVYLMNREEGYSIDEIAGQLGLAPQTVKNTLGRAVKSIRTHLDSNGFSLPMILLLFFLQFY